MVVEKERVYEGAYNGARIQITNVKNRMVSYRDLKSGKVFTVGYETFKRLKLKEVV